MHAMPLIIGVLCCMAIAYRYYSAFLAAKVLALDDTRPTPAHVLSDGQNFHPTNKWVLFGHHFAAISGAGPLIGPVLAIQFGYLPGLLWIVIGVCLAGAVQDMLVLGASVRCGGRSLAEIARAEIGKFAGSIASVTILYVVIVALAGLGVVVVGALGGEEIKLPAGTQIQLAEGEHATLHQTDVTATAQIPGGASVIYPDGKTVKRSEPFTLTTGAAAEHGAFSETSAGIVTASAGIRQAVPGSAWGTFTIACTVPIALFVGLYMYRLRKGHIVEASLIGATATLAATVAGNWVHDWGWAPYFSLSRTGTILAITIYGFIASVLPVWLLLCPRDYLSSFLKIGTVILLVGAVIVANPILHAPPVNEVFMSGGGPNVPGALFPFCFICIMCGAISGFHALVSSGTTPKMISSEGQIRIIGYGAMLIEGLVGVVALLAAASLPSGDYYAINIALDRQPQFVEQLKTLNATQDNLADIEQRVGGESLRGRTGGAVTLAVGMSSIFQQATAKLTGGDGKDLDSVLKYWYHFAIMFEALFILTTIDTGTRIARFLLQEILAKAFPKFEKTDWIPGAVFATAAVTAAWGGLIWSGSIDTIWPMFGIANQLLAVIALTVVTTVMFNAGKGRYAWVTLPAMIFVTCSTLTAGAQLITGRFASDFSKGLASENWALTLKGGLNITFTALMILSVLTIIGLAVAKWMQPRVAER
jgi:carbon starvation protein